VIRLRDSESRAPDRQDYSSFMAALVWRAFRFGTPEGMSYKLKAGHTPCAQEAGFHAQEHPAHSRRLVPRGLAAVEPAVAVVDDLPAFVPVRQQEIEVIETYLGALVDEALAGTESEISRRRE